MALLDQLLECTQDSIRCELTVRADKLFDQGGLVPAYLGIEYMAQSVAAYSGYWRHQEQLPAKIGFLLGTRRFQTDTAHFEVGQTLLVCATKVMQSSNGMASFNCTVDGYGVAQSAALSVFEPGDEVLDQMFRKDKK